MEIVPDHIKVLSYLFMIAYMLSVGLETTPGQIISTLRDSKLTAYALIANLLLVPIAGLILTRFFSFAPDIRTGLLLIAIAPGGLFALNFIRVSHGNIYLAVALFFLLSVIGIIVTPALAHFFLSAEGNTGFVFRLIVLLLSLILIPVIVGRFLARYLSSEVAQKLAKGIGTISILLFVLVNILTSKAKSPALKFIGTSGIAFIVLLVIISWAIGWLLGGKEVRNKLVMAISTSMRNVGVCLPIAINEFPGTNVIIPILAFSGVAIPMNFLFALVSKLALHKRKGDLAQQDEPIG